MTLQIQPIAFTSLAIHHLPVLNDLNQLPEAAVHRVQLMKDRIAEEVNHRNDIPEIGKIQAITIMADMINKFALKRFFDVPVFLTFCINITPSPSVWKVVEKVAIFIFLCCATVSLAFVCPIGTAICVGLYLIRRIYVACKSEPAPQLNHFAHTIADVPQVLVTRLPED